MLKIDLSKTSNQLGYALLTESAGKAITVSDVAITNLAVIDGAAAGEPNATIQLSSVAGSTVVKPGGVEPLTRKLTRHDLAEIATTLGADLSIEDDVTLYTDQYAVTKLNSILGSVLQVGEVTVTAPAAVDGVREVTIAMIPTAHFALFGSVTLTVTDNTDTRGTTEETFPNESLSGFDGPDAPAGN